MFLIVTAAAFLGSYLVQNWLKSAYGKWSAVPNAAGINGYQAARHILDSNGLQHVQVEVSKGKLSDHYIPSKKLMRLSEQIYSQPSVASIAVAAHEVGHALQDSNGYFMLRLKAVLMPLAAFASNGGLIMAMAGGFMGAPNLMQLGMFLFVGAMGIQILALPIEFDASRRALNQLINLRLVDDKDIEGTRRVLRAAAMTYVASAATSIMFIAIVAYQFLGRK